MTRFMSVSLATMTIGQRLQAFRKSAGLSQRELARRAGLKNSTLSTIEQDKVSPTIASLEKILTAIPVSLDAFFSAAEPQMLVRRAAELYQLEKDGMSLRLLALDYFQETTALSRLAIRRGESTELANNEANSLLAGMVAEGSVVLNINGVDNELNEGDAFELSYACRYRFYCRSRRQKPRASNGERADLEGRSASEAKNLSARAAPGTDGKVEKGQAVEERSNNLTSNDGPGTSKPQARSKDSGCVIFLLGDTSTAIEQTQNSLL